MATFEARAARAPMPRSGRAVASGPGSGASGGAGGIPALESAALPKFLQVSEALMRDIGSGALADGVRLPPEREFSAAMGVSVGTLRKALAELSRRGLIERIHGSGNYVKARAVTDSIYGLFRLELVEGGGLPRAVFLDMREMKKPGDLPPFGTSCRATRMRRLRSLDETPVAVEEIWLDLGVGALSPNEVSESLYRAYWMALGLRITRVEDRVSVGVVPDWAPDRFAPRAGSGCGFVERIGWGLPVGTVAQADAGGRNARDKAQGEGAGTVEYSRTWFDPAKAVYVQRSGSADRRKAT